ncbi:MAG TPA: thiamine-phosphate kinase [Acidimicrobiales bacterium]
MLPPNPTTAPRGGGVWREDVSLERIAALLEAASGDPAGRSWGDDAAVLAAPAGRLVLCTDAGVAGVHLDDALFPIGDLGYRTAIAALSDLAAMGATPLGVVIAICAPGDVDVIAIEHDAIAACSVHGCEVVGGDLSRAATTVATVTALGEERSGPAVRRSGARPGDRVFVTGELGGAALGRRRRGEGAGLDDPAVLRHRRPEARLAAGAAAARCRASSMIDVSDGLARDVRRIASASSVGIALHAVPLFDGALLEDGLGGGEDYELVLTHPDAVALASAFEEADLAGPIEIGVVVEDPAALTFQGAALPDVGWRH